MNQKTILTLIAVVLIAILAVLVIESREKTPSEKVADSVEEVTNEIADEVDDLTTN